MIRQACLLLVGCLMLGGGAVGADEKPKVPSDANIKKLVVGKWLHDYTDDNGVKVKATTTYKKDGTWSASGDIEVNGMKISIKATGTWSVEKGKLTEVVETCEPPLVPKGTKETDEVLEITDKIYKYKDDEGKTREAKRVKD